MAVTNYIQWEVTHWSRWWWWLLFALSSNKTKYGEIYTRVRHLRAWKCLKACNTENSISSYMTGIFDLAHLLQNPLAQNHSGPFMRACSLVLLHSCKFQSQSPFLAVLIQSISTNRPSTSRHISFRILQVTITVCGLYNFAKLMEGSQTIASTSNSRYMPDCSTASMGSRMESS